MKIIAVIPARGGSKGIFRKNIKLLAGEPLIAYTIKEARKSKYLDKIIVTTDDPEIADISLKYGAEVPFMRPKQLAEDNTPDLPVFQHALAWLKEHWSYIPDIIVHLRPTSPLRTVKHIDSGIELILKDKNADSVRSVCEPSQSPYKMWKIKEGYLVPIVNSSEEGVELYSTPRQSLPKVYWQTASVDIIRYNTIMGMNSMAGKRILPFLIEEKYSLDVDTELDFLVAETVLKNKE